MASLGIVVLFLKWNSKDSFMIGGPDSWRIEEEAAVNFLGLGKRLASTSSGRCVDYEVGNIHCGKNG